MNLTPHERLVMALVSIGRNNKQIGAGLGITENTVKHHLSHVYEKLRVDDRKKALEKINQS